jgi:DNA (cytosine-5)-methyltransferase 1
METIEQLPPNGFTVLDCFCGMGVGAIGTEAAGFETTYAFDYAKHAVRNFNKNIVDVAHVIDANDVTYEDFPDADVITGGFPCKPWSEGGKREGADDKKHGNLAQWLINLIMGKKPKAFLIENVKGLVNKNNRPFFNEMVRNLETEFDVWWQVLDASLYGVPQKRERVFIIGLRKDLNGSFEFPKQSDKVISIREALADLPDIPDGKRNHEFHASFALRKDERPYVHKVPEGGCWKNLPEEDQKAFMGNAYYNTNGGRTTMLSVVDRDKPARTIMSFPMGKTCTQIMRLAPDNIRRYTVRESLRLQSVPDSFVFDDETPVRDQYERVGGGIPSLLMWKVMQCLADSLRHASA